VQLLDDGETVTSVVLSLLLAAAPVGDAGVSKKAKAPRPTTPVPPNPATIEARQFRWDIPNVVSEVDMPGETVSMGVPVRLRAVVVKGKVEDVAKHILASFMRQKLWVPPHEYQTQPLGSGAQLTAFDPFNNVSYSVIFQANEKGLLTLILGESNIGALAKKSPNEGPLVYPGVSDVLATRLEGMKTLSYAVAESQEKVLEHYRSALPKQGYRSIAPEVYRKGSEEVRVTARADKGLTHVMVVVTNLPAEEDLTK
jgi:hypothetical protein